MQTTLKRRNSLVVITKDNPVLSLIFNMICTYKIINVKNGRYYIGSTEDKHCRWDRHLRELRKNKHHCIYLQRSWNKYGEYNFNFEVDKKFDSIGDARKLEQEYLDDKSLPLYNISKKAGGGDLISCHPNRDEIVSKMTESVQKHMNKLTVEEKRELYGSPGSKNGMFGKTHTSEVKTKLSDRMKDNNFALGCKWTPEQKAKLSKVASMRTGEKNPFYGKHHKERVKKAISLKNKGRKPSNCIPVIIDGVKYDSMTLASKELDIGVPLVRYRLQSKNFPTYMYKESQ